MANGSKKLVMCLWISPNTCVEGSEPSDASKGWALDPAAADLFADVWGAAGNQRVSLRLGEGPLAFLLGAAIIFIVETVAPSYSQVTEDDSRGGSKRKQPLPFSRVVVMSTSLQIKFSFPQWTSHLWEAEWGRFIPVPDYCFLGNTSNILLLASLFPVYLCDL